MIKHPRQLGGLSLIEAVVTMLVLGVGMIGVAALQVKAGQATQINRQQNLAVIQAFDLYERLLANKAILKLADDSAEPDDPTSAASVAATETICDIQSEILKQWIADWSSDNLISWDLNAMFNNDPTKPTLNPVSGDTPTITIYWTNSAFNVDQQFQIEYTFTPKAPNDLATLLRPNTDFPDPC